jgi:hypothetical protein
MARRYCGTATCALKYDDNQQLYVGRVFDETRPGTTSYRFKVRPPASSARAVDSSEAYDDAARAAFRFADADKPDCYGLDYDGTDIQIFRNRVAQDRAYASRAK